MRPCVKPLLNICAILSLSVFISGARAQQGQAATGNASNASSQIQKKIEDYLRHLYAFGPDVLVSVGPPKDTAIQGLQEIDIQVKIAGNQQSAKFYISQNGKYLFRGELSDLSKDHLAETREKLQTTDSPSTGDSRAPVTLVEFRLRVSCLPQPS